MISIAAKSEGQDPGLIERLRAQVDRMQATLAVLRAHAGRLRLALEAALLDRDRLQAQVRVLERSELGHEALVAQNERLRGEVARLQEKVEALQRSSRRQAAPFSKGSPSGHPRRAGRRAGPNYGTKAHRQVPDHIDEVLIAPLPGCCPSCGGDVVLEGIDHVFQQELPVVVPINRRFDVHRGHCTGCGRAVRGRHPDQGSEALGAAACHLGPRAVGHAVVLSKECGLSAGKIARLFGLLGLAVTPGGIVGILHRAARAALPTYRALVEGVRSSAVVCPDETGWRVGGRSAWLWAFVGEGVTVYLIAPGRGFAQAAIVLGGDFAGVIVRDGWASYRKFVLAMHQTCLAHLLRRCHEMVDAGASPELALEVRGLLKDGLALRDAKRDGGIDPDAYLATLEDLGARRDELVAADPADPAGSRLVKHLRREADALFSFLALPGVEATNHQAERAIRPAVVNRKAWGGNRTWAGAATQQVLASLLRTARQQGKNPIEILIPLLTSPCPRLAALAIPARRPPRLALPVGRSP